MLPIESCLVMLCVVSVMIGCGDESVRESASVGAETKEVSPLDSMRAAIRSGDWQAADQFSEAVLISHSDDPEVLSQVARVAHENKRPDAAIGLLVDAAHAGELADVASVRRAATGLISVGRVFDAMDLLAEAVRRHPDQDESRRWLFDFLVIFERHTEAVPHGRELVRRRKFDAELLIELSNTEKRDLENDSLDQMVERNPDDKRPLIGAAKKLFDQGKLAESETMLREILDVHPQYLPAQLLRGRTLADLGRFDELEQWDETVSGLRGHDAEWMYWSVQGDWARSAGDYAGAARAYWEATRRNADVALVWAKLASTLRQLPEMNDSDTPATQMETTIDAVQRRANRLSQAIQAKKRFDRSGRDSRVEAANVATTLFLLGRPWEAEAWAAIGLGFPVAADEPEVDVNAIRQKIVESLRRDTPWQVIGERTELACDLSHLPKPKQGSSGSVLAAKSAPPVTVASIMPTLRNEAVERGLNFFGRTRDDLDQPGIPIYAELGCGGGAIDFDLDGWCDLYLSAAGGTPPHRDSSPNALWRNLNGRLVDIGSRSGTTDTGFGQGVAVGDLNEDGFPDLLVLNYGENVIYINNGDGTFSDATADLMPGPLSRWSSSGAIADIDGDGLSDVVVLNYCAGLDPVTDSCVDEAKGIHKSCAPIYFSAEADNLFHNRGDGTFTDVTEDWGFKPAILGRGLGVVVSSLDGSPGLDIFVANDMSNNHYYSRSPSESMRLVESGISRGLATDDRSNPQASMGIATADMDRDGDMDIYITNFEDEYNTFHQQNGSGFWLDRTLQQNLSEAAFPMVGFGSEAVDFDNDGLLELVVANGHVDFPVSESESEYLQPMQVYYQDIDGRFSIFDTARSGRYLSTNHSGRALWTIDIDRNGKVDLVVTHQTEPVALLVNQTETDHHHVSFRLVGRSVSRDAIGAVVVVEQEDHRWTGVVSSGDGYLCSNERVVRFGLGDNNMPVTVSISWPDGSEQVTSQVAVDREWVIVQGQEPF